MILSPTSKIGYHHRATNITMSPTSLSPSFLCTSFRGPQNSHSAEVNYLRRCISSYVVIRLYRTFYFLGKFLDFGSEKITMVLSSVICVFIPLWIFISSSEKYLGFEMSPNVTQNVTVRLALCQFLTFKWNHVEHPNSNI